MSDPLVPFHLAFPAVDLAETAAFYIALGCRLGRTNSSAVTLDLHGHQVVAHRVEALDEQQGIYPRHFGLLLDEVGFADLRRRAARVAPDLVVRERFAGTFLAHLTMLMRDPSGNQLEFKCYADRSAAFHRGTGLAIGDTPS